MLTSNMKTYKNIQHSDKGKYTVKFKKLSTLKYDGMLTRV